MKTKIIKWDFLTPGELKKVKAADLGGKRVLTECRDAFVMQCENGLRFRKLKETYQHEGKNLFDSLTEAKYVENIFRLLKYANVPLVHMLQEIGSIRDGITQIYRRLNVSSQLGYNTYVEHKNYEARKLSIVCRLAANSDAKDFEYNELPSGRKYLTFDELKAIREIVFVNNNRLKDFRDKFIRQCCTGVLPAESCNKGDVRNYSKQVGQLLLLAGIVKPYWTKHSYGGHTVFSVCRTFYPNPRLARRTYAVNSHINGYVLSNILNA